MALIVVQSFTEVLLSIGDDASFDKVHILEPEYHQVIYTAPGERARTRKGGSFQIGSEGILTRTPSRGRQPDYVDDPDDPDTMFFIGMLDQDGNRLTDKDTQNIAALKSVSVRSGHVDIDSARCVSSEFYERHKDRCGVRYGDVLVNSTGDGTIGRVAVYHYTFPAVVDGHITILRFTDQDLGWFTAGYLGTEDGQHQLYRYVNGSSGQVEIYPQDIERLWIPKPTKPKKLEVANAIRLACQRFESFQDETARARRLASRFSGS
jgi:type I restriction enzyme M protein